MAAASPSFEGSMVGTPRHVVGVMPGEAEVVHQQEMMRIHDLWSHTKGELKAKARQLEDMEREHLAQADRMRAEHSKGLREMQGICMELKDKVRSLEGQLQAARDEGRRLADAADEGRRQAAEAKSRLDQTASVDKARGKQLVELKDTVRSLQRERTSVLDRAQSDQRRLEDKVLEQSKTIARLETEVAKFDRERRTLLADRDAEADRREALERRVADADQMGRGTASELSVAREQLRQLARTGAGMSRMQVLVDQLQVDNARLVKLLASTADFRDFIGSAEDAGGLTYLAPVAGAAAMSDEARRAIEGDSPPRGAAHESERWVPSDAYAIASAFRHDHAPGVKPEHFAELLLRLNSVWRRREQRSLARARRAFQEEHDQLSRKAAHAVPYVQVLQEAEIDRLRRELRGLRTSGQAGRRRLDATEERLLDSALAAVESLSAQVAAAKDKDAVLSSGRGSAGAAAAAAARTAADTVDVLADKVAALVRDFQHKSAGLARDDPDWLVSLLKLQGAFVDAVKRRVGVCR